MNRPFFARLLDREDLRQVSGGRHQHGLRNACEKNPNCEPPLTTLKAGNCGNDCDSDHPSWH